MGKFFNGRVKNDRSKLIRYGVIAGGVLLILIVIMMIVANNRGGKATLTLKESLDVEVGSKLPDKMEYFSEFDNFDKDKIEVEDDEVDIDTIGTYTVTVSAKGMGSENVEVNVVDTQSPSLTLKNVTIASGENYQVEDFVASCSDNYDEACIVEFYTGNTDQNGNAINYANFTEDGTYTVMIIAKDESGNASAAQNATLVIGKSSGGNIPPVSCSHGDLKVKDNLGYPVAVIVGDKNSNCALSLELWNDKTTQAPVDAFYKADYERLKNQVSPILKNYYPNGAKITVEPHYLGVLNEKNTGLVGYAIFVKVYVSDQEKVEKIDANLKMAYYLRSDKTREYSINEFNIGQ